MTTSIVEHVGKGDFNEALVYAAILLGLAFAINAVLTSVQQRAASTGSVRKPARRSPPPRRARRAGYWPA